MADTGVTISKQRNINDVAMELTELYYKLNIESPTREQLEETYSKFYDTALENLKKR